MAKTEREDVTVQVITGTHRAWRLRDVQGRDEWFPASEIVIKDHDTRTGEAIAVIPCWLLTTKGW